MNDSMYERYTMQVNLLHRAQILTVSLTLAACQQPVAPDFSAAESGRTFDVVFAGSSIVDGRGNDALHSAAPNVSFLQGILGPESRFFAWRTAPRSSRVAGDARLRRKINEVGSTRFINRTAIRAGELFTD